jgi:F-type H+-transporting ATPase subunit b
MRSILHSLLACLAVVLFATAPALAAGDGHGKKSTDHAEHDDHGAAAGHGDGEHQEEGEHHVAYTHDDDGDGVPNWRDPSVGPDDNDTLIRGLLPALYYGENDGFVVARLFFHCINLALFLGVVFYFARTPFQDYLRGRAAGIREEIETAVALRDEATARAKAVETRLTKVEDELAAIEANARDDAAAEHTLLVARAEAEAKRIGETAQRNIRDEVARARHILRRDAVELAVELARKTLTASVQSSDQQRLAREFLDAVKGQGETHA